MSWNLEGLKTLFDNQDGYAVATEGDCLLITNSDGIESYLTVSGDQMLVETILFSTDAIKDPYGLSLSCLVERSDVFVESHHLMREDL